MTRKNTSRYIKERVNIIRAYDNMPNKSVRGLSQELNIKRGTLRSILDNRDAILAEYEKGVPPKRKRMRCGQPGIVIEVAIADWVKRMNDNHQPISADLIKVSFLFSLSLILK